MHTHLKFDAPDRAVSATYWHDGCVLQIHGNRCLVRGSVEGRIYIQVQGAEDTRREALALIRERLADIRDTIRELQAVEMIPVPDQPGVAVEHATVVENLRERIDRFIPPGGRAVSASELLVRVDTDARRSTHKLPAFGELGAGAPTNRPRIALSLEKPKLPKPVDFGIITMKEEEYRAVERQFAPVERFRGKKQPYLLGRVATQHGEKTALIVRCLEQGQKAAQQCANNLIQEARPRWILLVGIAGALPAEEYTLGDVLLANWVYDFAITAAVEGAAPEQNPGGGRVHPDVAYLLREMPSAACQQQLGAWNGPAALSMPKPKLRIATKLTDPPFYGDKKWREKVQKRLKASFPAKKDPRLPVCRIVPVGTANVLMKDTEQAKGWQAVARAVGHVEMELGGVHVAAEEDKVPVLSIRGISDVVGFRRSSAWTEYACQTAAAFSRALVGSGLIDLS
jgi:nucleoside phosphorylase